MAKSIAYTVIVETPHGDAEVDTVFSTETDPAEVRKSLVNHDGYDPRIIVLSQTEARKARCLDWNGPKGRRYRNQ